MSQMEGRILPMTSSATCATFSAFRVLRGAVTEAHCVTACQKVLCAVPVEVLQDVAVHTKLPQQSGHISTGSLPLSIKSIRCGSWHFRKRFLDWGWLNYFLTHRKPVATLSCDPSVTFSSTYWKCHLKEKENWQRRPPLPGKNCVCQIYHDTSGLRGVQYRQELPDKTY